VKTKKKDNNLRELFRQKLENSEVTPDAAVKSKLMRKVARKEFLRFNPARINIFYAGGLLIAGITTILLLSGPQNLTSTDSEKPSAAITQSDTLRISEVTALVPVRSDPGKTVDNKTVAQGNNSLSALNKKSVPSQAVKVDSEGGKAIQPVVINNSLSKKGIFDDRGVVQKKLKTGFKTDVYLIDPVNSVGCAPLKVRFHNMSVSGDSCRWTFGDGGSSGEKDPEWIFDVEGEYKITLQVFNRNGKSMVSTAKVTVHSKPQAHFEISPAGAILPNDEIRFMNYSIDAMRYKWEFGDGNISNAFEPDHKYRKYNNYNVRLIAWSEYGCTDSMFVKNAFSGSGCFIDFPNAFIPGADGPVGGYYSTKSDEAARIFHPSTSGVSEYLLRIFSKLGILIFESNDVNIGWDGYLKGQLCEQGVYIWKVRGTFKNGEPFVKMGDVTLLKN
jgi:hypothetical protein